MKSTKQTTVKRQLSQSSEQLLLHGTRYTKLKTLGTGIFGTTYEVVAADGSNPEEHLALKVQKITPEHQTPNNEYQLWREIEFQDQFVKKLSPTDKEFFVRLYDYEIITECQHQQKRRKVRTITRPRNKWEAKIFAIDQSPICAYFLMDLVRGMTINEYLLQIFSKPNGTPPRMIIINLAQQFLKCLELLQHGGYGHNDEHLNNLMMEPLAGQFKTDFKLGARQILKLKYQLKLIDYGLINHAKYKQNPKLTKDQELFLTRPDDYYYAVALRALSSFFTNSTVCKLVYEIHGKKEPAESNPRLDQQLNLLKNIAMSHPRFLTLVVGKYSAQYPALAEYITNVFQQIKTVVTHGLIKDPSKPLKPENYFYLSELLRQITFLEPCDQYLTEFVLFKITEEFRVRHPKEHLEYSGYELVDARMLQFLAPKKDYLQVLGFTSLPEVISWAYECPGPGVT